MRFANIVLCSTIAAQVIFSSCKKTNDVAVDATTNTNVTYQVKATNTTSLISQRTEGTSIQWTSGFANATLIKFEATKTTGGEVEFKTKTAQRINLLAPVAGSLGNVTIAAGTYREVEFKIQLNKNGNEAALELVGQFAGANGNVPVILRVNDAFEIKAERENVIISSTDLYTALTNIDLSKVTAGITQAMLAGAKVTSDGIVISSTSNTNLYNQIITNLSKSHESEIEHHTETEAEHAEHHHG